MPFALILLTRRAHAVRITYVTETYTPEVNGVALTVARAVRHLRKRGHALDLIRPRQRGEEARCDEREWRTAGAPIPMYPDLRFGMARVATVARRLAANRTQLVHVATQGPLGRAALLAARRLALPVTTDFRTNFHAYCRYYHLGAIEPLVCRYLRNFHNGADCCFVPTRALAQTLQTQGFERLEVVGRGVDAKLFTPARRSAALRASWGVRGDAPVLLYVGRLAPEKNVALALQTHARLLQQRPDAHMVVVGDGPLRAQLRLRFPLARFVGMQRNEDLAEHYASADLFLFPSESETFGNVTLEALASGLAVVAFDEAAAAEHIRDGVSGLLVAPGDAAGFMTRAMQAVQSQRCRPQSMMRQLARETALAAQWDGVLQHFEQRLAHHAIAHAAAGLHDVALA